MEAMGSRRWVPVSGVSNMVIGSATNPLAANVIAHQLRGIVIDGRKRAKPGTTPSAAIRSTTSTRRRSYIYPGANDGIAAPLIGSLGPVHGTTCPSCFVDVFSDDAGDGRIFEGTAQADNIGIWTFTGLFAGPYVTAIATDADGNSSEFSAAFAIPATPFTDIGDSSFKKDIEWLHANGITKGCAATLYCPKDPVTREQMASFIAREMRLPSTTTDYFTDDESSTHEADINRLAASGITTGCTATTFCPTGLVLRDQMASFLARATKLTVGGGRDYFNDDDGNTHEVNIDRTAAGGLTTGCGSYVYCPSSSVTREQMAAFLRRVIAPGRRSAVSGPVIVASCRENGPLTGGPGALGGRAPGR